MLRVRVARRVVRWTSSEGWAWGWEVGGVGVCGVVTGDIVDGGARSGRRESMALMLRSRVWFVVVSGGMVVDVASVR